MSPSASRSSRGNADDVAALRTLPTTTEVPSSTLQGVAPWLISADSHVIEPYDLWQQRLTGRFREESPRLIHDISTDRLVCAHMNLDLPIGLVGGMLRDDDDVRIEGRWETDVPRGAYDVSARLRDMSRDSVFGEVLFPTIGLSMYGIRDLELLWEFVKVYNDWMADFCAGAPDRLRGIAVLIPDDPKLAASEIVRTKEMGMAGAMLPLATEPADLAQFPSRAFDVVWATAQEMDMPLHFHTSTSRSGRIGYGHVVDHVVAPVAIEVLLGHLIFGGTLDRFPRLQVVSVENDASWIANFAERSDYIYRRYRKPRADQILCKRQPSEILAQQVSLTFTRDQMAAAAAEMTGVRLLWGSDYPHNSSTWPNSSAEIERQFEGHDRALRDASTFTNAAELYGFSVTSLQPGTTGERQD
jgi:predicted TIM-barrel fold metal-dependent hydrolase